VRVSGTHKWSTGRHGWILVSQRRPYRGRAYGGTEKGAKGQRKIRSDRERAREREREGRERENSMREMAAS